MTALNPFQRVLVPVEFVLADPAAVQRGEAIEAGGQQLELPTATQRSLEVGARLSAGGKLLLVHATPSLAYAGIYGGPEGTWMPSSTINELDEQARKHSLAILEDLAARHCKGASVDFRAPPGAPTDVVLAEAEAFDADLIVLATSGRGRARRFFLGSTADKIIRQAQCPTLVIPADVEPGD
jgi:nucleotide-binding universal stress UspA family protein